MKMRMVIVWLFLMAATAAMAQTGGNGDGADFSTTNVELDTWWGVGVKSLCCPSYSGNYGIVFNARSGSIYTQGNIGIGTATPSAPLEIVTGNINGGYQFNNAITLRPAGGSAYGENGTSIYLGSMTNHGPAAIAGIWSALGSGGDGSVNYDGALVLGTIPTGSLSAIPLEQMRISSAGRVGIGTTLPAEKLEVSGNIKLTAGTGSHITFADSTQQSTAWTGVLSGGDYAESVDISRMRDSLEPGDLITIDAEQNGRFLKSAIPYSPLVSGVYATKPGVVGRRQPRTKSQEDEVPMAMVGIVPTKVSTENGPIRRGDLLVSSSTPGYAMKGTDRDKLTGAVLGKALETLDSGKGVIEVLISLQ